MDRRYANRGRTLEALLEQACARYRAVGRGVILKIPTGWVPVRDSRSPHEDLAAALGYASRPIRGVRPVGSPVVDFFGFFADSNGVLRPIAFDAKSTGRPSWPLRHLPAHQAAFLAAVARYPGAVCGLVLEFRSRAVFWLPYGAVAEALARHAAGGRASISYAEAAQWGVRIPPGPSVALDFLAAVEVLGKRATGDVASRALPG